MSSIEEVCKSELREADILIGDIKVQGTIINGIKNKTFNRIIFKSDDTDNETVIVINDLNRDIIVQMMIELNRHTKSILTSKLTSVSNQTAQL